SSAAASWRATEGAPASVPAGASAIVGSLVEEQEASSTARSAATAALRRPLAGRISEFKGVPCLRPRGGGLSVRIRRGHPDLFRTPGARPVNLQRYPSSDHVANQACSWPPFRRFGHAGQYLQHQRMLHANLHIGARRVAQHLDALARFPRLHAAVVMPEYPFLPMRPPRA